MINRHTGHHTVSLLLHCVATTVNGVNNPKSSVREFFTSRRKGFTQGQRAADDAAIAAACSRLAQGRRVAAYSPLGSEPGGRALLPALADAASELFLPISGPDSALLWARYDGPDSLGPGALGILEPLGPRRDSSLLHELDLILVPALACSPEGVRLGKGAGYYDRALTGCNTPTVVVLYDGEISADVPAEPHDAVMERYVCPAGVFDFPA